MPGSPRHGAVLPGQMARAGKRAARDSGASDAPDLARLLRAQIPDVTPEHERDYPATSAIEADIRAHWDGSGVSAHDIGHAYHSPIAGHAFPCYPGWRIEQIAWGLGGEVIERAVAHARGERAALPAIGRAATARWRKPPTDIATEVRSDITHTGEHERKHGERGQKMTTATTAAAAAAAMAAASQPRQYDHAMRECATCGKAFKSTYYANGGWTKYCSRACITASQRQMREASLAVPVASVAAVHERPVEVDAAREEPEAEDVAQVDAARETPVAVEEPAAACRPAMVVDPAVLGHLSNPISAQRVVRLPSGASVSLVLTGNPLLLPSRQRAFLGELLDACDAYEFANRASQPLADTEPE